MCEWAREFTIPRPDSWEALYYEVSLQSWPDGEAHRVIAQDTRQRSTNHFQGADGILLLLSFLSLPPGPDATSFKL